MKLIKIGIRNQNIIKVLTLSSGYLDSKYIYIYIPKQEDLRKRPYSHHEPCRGLAQT